MKAGRPRTDRDRLTIRLLPVTQEALTHLAGQIPGMTPNRLVAAMVEQSTPALEELARALEEQRAGQGVNATERLIGVFAGLSTGIAGMDRAAISNGLAAVSNGSEDATRGTDAVPS